MPDLDCSFQSDTTRELQQILLSRNEYQGGGVVKKERFNSKKLESNGLQGRGHVYRTAAMSLKVQSAPKKVRGKESSKHFGVRFRPDLYKWVAEIRVAEWKSVDKKVWLGTFDTEVGAARAVDAARKLLKCKKKRPPNFPCLNLEAYVETIPSHLNLNDLGNDAMFKEVTLFVKHKVQEYAASFGPSMLSNCVSVVASHPSSSYSQPPPSPRSQQEHKFSFLLQPSYVSSCEDDGNFKLHQDSTFASFQSIPTISSSSSSLSSSYWEEDEFCWAYVNEPVCSFDTFYPFPSFSNLTHDQSTVECETMHAKLPSSSWEEPNLFFLIDDIRDDELLLDNVLVGGSENHLIPSNNQAYNHAQELTSMDISYNELPSNNCSANPDCKSDYQRTASRTVDVSMLQQLHSFNNCFSGPLDCPSVQVF